MADDNRIRPGVWLAVIGSLAALVVVLAVFGGRRPSRAPQPPPAAPDSASSSLSPDSASSRSRAPVASRTPAHPSAPEQPPEYIDGLVYGEIDLREARELMPDNLYWKWGSPTKDEKVLAERDAEKARRNQEYGKVLSGDATEDEVRAYYDYRKRLSSDYLEFSEFMARRFKDSDNKEFVGMLELATKMHAQRLAQLPAELEEALARSLEREKMREDWRRQQEEFGPGGGLPTGNEDGDEEP